MVPGDTGQPPGQAPGEPAGEPAEGGQDAGGGQEAPAGGNVPGKSQPPETGQPAGGGQGATGEGTGDAAPQGPHPRVPPPPSHGRPAIRVMGFYTDPEPGLPGSLPTALREARSISYVCPFWYQVGFDGDGSVIPYGPGYDADAARVVTRALQQCGVKVLALLHNMRLGQPHDTRAIFHEILVSAEERQALVANILTLLQQMGFDGLNLDTEFVNPEDRPYFTQFVAELAAALHPAGMLLTADVPAKTHDDPAHAWSGGVDLAALAQYLDLVAVMTYDEHGYVTEAGPVASIDWVRQAVRYSVSVIPPEKILLGLAGHAFDWEAGSNYPCYTWYGGVMATAGRYGATAAWDEESSTPFVSYTDPATGRQRQAWFENRDSYIYKLALVEEYGLGGICLWRLGLEDPDLWPLLEERCTVVK